MRRALVTLAGVLVLALAGAVPAFAETPSPWWWTGVEVSPTNLVPEHEGFILAVASDLGDAPANSSGGQTIVLSDRLPEHLTVTAITGQARHGASPTCSVATVQCTFSGILYPYERVSIAIRVKVAELPGTVTTLPNEVSVEGGGAPRSGVQHAADEDRRRTDTIRRAGRGV